MGLWEFSLPFSEKWYSRWEKLEAKICMKPSMFRNQKRKLWGFFLGISWLWNQQACVWGHLFLMTFEYLKSIVVDFVFSVSPLYNSNTPTDSSRGPAGLSQFQNSVYVYLSTQKQILCVYLSCGQWAYTNLRHGFWVWFLVPSAQMHSTMISPLINVLCLG